jgi:hypothetical protein
VVAAQELRSRASDLLEFGLPIALQKSYAAEKLRFDKDPRSPAVDSKDFLHWFWCGLFPLAHRSRCLRENWEVRRELNASRKVAGTPDVIFSTFVFPTCVMTAARLDPSGCFQREAGACLTPSRGLGVPPAGTRGVP